MSATITVVAHRDDTIRTELVEALERDEGIIVGAAGAHIDLDAWPGAVLVAGVDDLNGSLDAGPIVVIAENAIGPAAREALAIGAAGFVAWPQEADELASTVRAAAVRAVARVGDPRGGTIAVAGARGGLGVTTLAAWIAREATGAMLIEVDERRTVNAWCHEREPGDLRAVARRPSTEALSRESVVTSFGVPCLAGGLGDSGEVRALIDVLATVPIAVLDLGLLPARAERLWRVAEHRIFLVGDDTGSLRAARDRVEGARWCARLIGRSGVRQADLVAALGRPPVASIRSSRRIARATDLGRLAPPPRGIRNLLLKLREEPRA